MSLSVSGARSLGSCRVSGTCARGVGFPRGKGERCPQGYCRCLPCPGPACPPARAPAPAGGRETLPSSEGWLPRIHAPRGERLWLCRPSAARFEILHRRARGSSLPGLNTLPVYAQGAFIAQLFCTGLSDPHATLSPCGFPRALVCVSLPCRDKAFSPRQVKMKVKERRICPESIWAQNVGRLRGLVPARDSEYNDSVAPESASLSLVSSLY